MSSGEDISSQVSEMKRKLYDALSSPEFSQFAIKRQREEQSEIKQRFHEIVDVDDSDDEIISWVKDGKLPANTESVLALNQAYQQILQKCLEEMADELTRTRNEQNFLFAEAAFIPKEKKLNAKVPSLLYIPPYFRDSSGMVPPHNDEYKRKMESGDVNFDMLLQPSRKWSNLEKSKLISAVEDYAFQKMIGPFLNKKDVLNEKLKSLQKTESKDCSAATKVRKELATCQKKLDSFNSKRLAGSLNLTDTEGIDWNQVAVVQLEGSRRAIECKLAWKNEFHPKINMGNWSEVELKSLKELVETTPKLSFLEIAEKLDTKRTAFHCAEKYQTTLNENLIKKQWTPEEDQILIDTINESRIGNHIPWAYVTSQLEGRTRNQCQVRWGRSLNPDLKHGRWTDEEDKLLNGAVKKYGSKDWGKIADIVVGRTDSQCRERWCTVLDGSIKKSQWTQEEDAILKHGVTVYGEGQWAKIRHLLPGRTPAMCKIRYRSTVRKQRLAGLKKEKKVRAKKAVTEKIKRARGRPKKVPVEIINLASEQQQQQQQQIDKDNIFAARVEKIDKIIKEIIVVPA